MKKCKIIKRIFTDYKELSFMNKIYLTHTYIQNIKNIRNNYSYHYHKYKFNEFAQTPKPTKTLQNGVDFKQELNQIKYALLKKRVNYIKDSLLKFVKRLNIKYLIDLKNSQNNVELIFDFLSRHIATYKNAIHELVEGQREVTQNKNFRFQDGETVQNKMDKFDNRIKEVLHIKK
jgi:hypothetical protein